MAKLIHVIEDDDDIRFILEYILLEANYNVMLFPTASAFEAAIIADKPDLIILDVMLPDGNGIEICRRLKINPETFHIPVLIMSAHAAQHAILEEACADDFISKPFDLDHFIDRVNQILKPVEDKGH
ncbi:response regulator transcription factor [Pedobacter sp. MC2016-24]|uniref:response regulator transcription factor n=1 Tax=Pedobacter sp. MC2016-24 TaxID=2780090 RepID=UPI0018821C77|nr:response regulator transcription factor [Pedobacter sp. MC2016-24]MBE9602547.1 response regulator transcription factor [Pedobacter sp. MC2016-24]